VLVQQVVQAGTLSLEEGLVERKGVGELEKG